MSVLTVANIGDAVIGILKDLGRGAVTFAMSELSQHVGFDRMCKKYREHQSDGYDINVRYATSDNGTAENVGLHNTQNFSADDSLVEGSVPLRFMDATMVFDERMKAMNQGASQIVDLVRMENARALTSMIELAEKDVWGIPASSSDVKTPWGVEYWVTKHASLGYYGGNPSGFSSGRAGINSTTYPRIKNYTGAYSDVSDTNPTGLIYMMEKAAFETAWVAPVPEPGVGRKGYSSGIYCNWDTKNKMKNVSKSNNDSLGFDLATKEPVFRGAAITPVPYFTDKSDNPVYMLDHNYIYAKFLKDWYFKRITIDHLPNQVHSVGIVISMAWNIVCDDVRRNAVFYEA